MVNELKFSSRKWVTVICRILMKSQTPMHSLLLIIAVLSLFNDSLITQWVSTGGPGTGASVRCFAVSGSYFFTGTWGGPNGYSGGVYRSTNNGTNWFSVNSGLTDTAVMAMTVNGSNLFAGTIGSGVFKTTNNGTLWMPVNTGLANLTIYSLITSGTNLIAGTQDGIFLSTNDGAVWSYKGLTGNLIFGIAEIGSNLFAGGYGGGVFRSSNNGTNWVEVNNGLTNTAVQCLTVNGTNLYAGTFSGVFRTNDNGANWINTLGLAGTIVNTLTESGSNIFAGTSGGGIYLTSNNGLNWASVGLGMPNTTINTLAVNGAIIFAGALNGNVYRRPLSEMITSVKILSNEMPIDFNMSQNYPNPFNPVSNIKYQISKSSFVRIKLYDLLGRETLTLFEGDQKAGYYLLTVDGNNLASGIYYCRINAADFSKVIKMSLIK